MQSMAAPPVVISSANAAEKSAGSAPNNSEEPGEFAQVLANKVNRNESETRTEAEEGTTTLLPDTTPQNFLGIFDLLPQRDMAKSLSVFSPGGNDRSLPNVTTLTTIEETANLAAEKPMELPEIIQGQQQAQTRSPHAAQATATTIATPLNNPDWGGAFNDKIVWLAKGQVQSAQINVTPAHLGHIQINISLNGDQLSASFVSAHSEVRQALEESIPRLRELLSEAGITLGQANVDSQASQQQHSPEQSPRAHRSSNEGAILSGDVPNETSGTIPIVAGGQGLVDLFA